MMWVGYKSSVRIARPLPTRGLFRRPATAITLVATLVVSVPALAALTPMAGSRAGNLHLIANGPGTVNAQGKIVAWGALPAPGRVEVRGKPGAFSVRINGVLQKPNRRGVVRLEGIDGRFAIQGGRGVKVRIECGGCDVSIAGRGSALAAGTGTYSLNGAPYVAWTGQPIPIAPPPKVRPPVKRPPSGSGNTPGGK